MMRVTPAVSQASAVAMSRIPPPSCTESPGTAAMMARTASALAGLPAKAPSRSTTCTQAKPARAKSAACAPGSAL